MPSVAHLQVDPGETFPEVFDAGLQVDLTCIKFREVGFACAFACRGLPQCGTSVHWTSRGGTSTILSSQHC